MRQRRLFAPGLFFHITARGNNRQNIFQTDDDKLDYLNRIPEIFAACFIRVLAYCLMTNHLHLLVQDARGTRLPAAMGRLQGGFAQDWNRRYGRSGHVFGDRYDPQPVESDSHLVTGSCYIHNNPPHAGMTKTAREYRWSSVHAYLGGKSDLEVSTDLILELCGGPAMYAKLLDETAGDFPEDDRERLPDSSRVRGLWMSGREVFRSHWEPKVERRLERRKLFRRPTERTLDQLVEEVLKRTGISREDICGPSRKRDVSHARALLCSLGRRDGIAATDIAGVIRRTRSAVVRLADTIDLKALGNG